VLTAAPPLLASAAAQSTPPSVNGPWGAAEQACQNGSAVCDLFSRMTGSRVAGTWAQVLVGTPLRIVLIVVMGYVLRYLLHRVIERIAERIAAGSEGLSRLDERLPTALLAASPWLSARREQRARTTASVLKSVTTGAVATVAVLMVLQALGIPIAPLLASAGIVGVALGFGSQALVKDFLSGLFMIVEDQYGVGDVVDLGPAVGMVEAVGLRVTRLRDADGAVWYVRNGEVLRVSNTSQGWARAVIDVSLPTGPDVEAARAAVLEVAQGLRTDEVFGALVVADPQLDDLEPAPPDLDVLRLVVRTAPLQQQVVARELRQRIRQRLDIEGIAAGGCAVTVIEDRQYVPPPVV
jgi:moderate conductance mechanosensitive channel